MPILCIETGDGFLSSVLSRGQGNCETTGDTE